MRAISYADVPYDVCRTDGRLERHCDHGIGHTVGHRDKKKLREHYIWVHGCDGCCKDYPKELPTSDAPRG